MLSQCSELLTMKVLRSALTFLLLAAANADAQQYDNLTSLLPAIGFCRYCQDKQSATGLLLLLQSEWFRCFYPGV